MKIFKKKTRTSQKGPRFYSISLGAELQDKNAQITELEKEKKAEKQRTEEIEEYKEYVGTDEYVEDTARDKLGMVKENEILFKAEE